MLRGKKILLAISGGIAAYKIPELIRRLKEQGAEVRVIMTQNASCFIPAMTLQAVSGEPVGIALMDPAAEASMSHIELGKWPDLVLLAPATANTIAKHANGIADDLVSTLLLARTAPLAIAPAMNQQMYQAAATQANLQTLRQRGAMLWGPASGEQACGDVGPGRMLQPQELLEHIQHYFAQQNVEPLLKGLNLTITAGPTREAIDPVRYISNHSSGKMGYALAEAAVLLGAKVNLISGPVALSAPSLVSLHSVTTAAEMLDTALQQAPDCDIFIACAAVADYRLADVATQKIKKSADSMQLKLLKNPDIVANVAKLEDKPYVVGFAAETQDVARYAVEKMQRKNLDMIAANDVSNADVGFNSDNNALQVFWGDQQHTLSTASKADIALALLTLIAQHYSNK